MLGLEEDAKKTSEKFHKNENGDKTNQDDKERKLIHFDNKTPEKNNTVNVNSSETEELKSKIEKLTHLGDTASPNCNKTQQEDAKGRTEMCRLKQGNALDTNRNKLYSKTHNIDSNSIYNETFGQQCDINYDTLCAYTDTKSSCDFAPHSGLGFNLDSTLYSPSSYRYNPYNMPNECRFNDYSFKYKHHSNSATHHRGFYHGKAGRFQCFNKVCSSYI